MNFLIVMTVVILVHAGKWIHYFQRDNGFAIYWKLFCVHLHTPRWLPFVLAVALPALLLAVLLFFFREWYVLLSVNLLVLLFAIGRSSWRSDCRNWVALFSEHDKQALVQKLVEQGAAPAGLSAQSPDADIENLWVDARRDVVYHQLDGFYAPVFWFLVPVAGAPLALFYRLLQLYRQQDLVKQGELPDMQQLLWLLEWIPVRIMAVLFCLVGNFTTGFWVFEQILMESALGSADVLARCADAALFLDGSVDETIEDARERAAKVIERMEAKALEQKTLSVMRRYSLELQVLLERTEVAFLVVAAMLALA